MEEPDRRKKGKEALKTMPKLELHCHLDGSLSPEFLSKRLGRRLGREELQAPEDCKSLAEYLERFSLPLKAMQDEEGLSGAAFDLLRSAAEENVVYLELRFAPLLSAREGLPVERVLESVLKGVRQGEKEYSMNVNVIVCAMRHHSEEENRRMLRCAREFLGEGVCAADLAGDEAAYPMAAFAGLFEEAKRLGMPFTIHAGECGSRQNIRDAILAGASRIGHGIAMAGSRELEKICRERNIGIELCPSSNLQTRAVSSRERYPFREFADAGLLVTVNTDNRTVSGTTVTRELEFLWENCGLTWEEAQKLMQNAVEVSFAKKEQRERLYEIFKMNGQN